MFDFEQDFYKFVKAQLDKKRGIKPIASDESDDEEELIKSNPKCLPKKIDNRARIYKKFYRMRERR